MTRKITIKRKDEKGKTRWEEPIRSFDEQTPNLFDSLRSPTHKFPNDPGATVELIRETRQYELITPLFGGGVEPGSADPISMITAKAVRGQLRFWWRATRGGEYPNLESFSEAESSIFGSTDNSSLIQISLNAYSVKRGNALTRLDDRNGVSRPIGDVRSPIGYAAFPLRQHARSQVTEGIEFELEFVYPAKIESDVKAALWSWETFGGIGARTRRGFGSVQNSNFSKAHHEDLLNWIQTGLASHLSSGAWPDDIPHLARYATSRYKLCHDSDTSLGSLKGIIDSYKRFRQFRRPRAFSRSNWPEPDAIRRLFPPPGHPRHRFPKTTLDSFPRANFGLPIVFSFKEQDVVIGDPTVTTLEGVSEKQKRFASPLIFRVTRLARHRFVIVALILNGTRVPSDGVQLTDAPGNPIVITTLTPTDAALPHISDILRGNEHVLEVFLASL